MAIVMNIRLLLIVSCVTRFLVTDGVAQVSQQLQFWQEATAKKALPEIARLISDQTKPGWPTAPSVSAIKNLPPDKQGFSQTAIALVKALHEKQRREFKANVPASSAEVRTYAVLSRALENAGGYSNVLLADSFRRLAVLRASEALVKGARPLDWRQEVEELDTPNIEPRTFLERLAVEDDEVSRNRPELEKIAPTQSVYAALQASGLGDASSLAGADFNELMEHPSAAGLLVRLTGTQMLCRVSLKGLLTFLEKGGTYQELDPADIRPFRTRMAGAEKSFQYPLLDVRYLRGGDVRVLFELQNEPPSRAAFLKAIWE